MRRTDSASLKPCPRLAASARAGKRDRAPEFASEVGTHPIACVFGHRHRSRPPACDLNPDKRPWFFRLRRTRDSLASIVQRSLVQDDKRVPPGTAYVLLMGHAARPRLCQSCPAPRRSWRRAPATRWRRRVFPGRPVAFSSGRRY